LKWIILVLYFDWEWSARLGSALSHATGKILRTDHQDESLGELPETVRDAVQLAAPGIHVTELEVMGSAGDTIYEVEGHADGKSYEIKG